jgi:hypothetical protein
MICADDKTALLNEFSQQVQHHFPDSVWRSLFEERTGRAQFGTAIRTVLCVQCPPAGGPTRAGVVAALSRLTRMHGGYVDPCSGEYIFASFNDPEDALRLALALQRICARAHLRMGVLTAPCKLVRGHADGLDILMLLGSARERAAALAGQAPSGTVQVAPETFEAVGSVISDELGSCLVMAEYDDGDVLREVVLTLPPDGNADLSTFAGLGLS